MVAEQLERVLTKYRQTLICAVEHPYPMPNNPQVPDYRRPVRILSDEEVEQLVRQKEWKLVCG